MARVDPASLADFATPGRGPTKAMRSIFGDVRGTHVDKMRWLAANSPALFEWAWRGVAFPWMLDDEGRPRALTAVDVEHSLCYFSKLDATRTRLGEAAKPLHDAVAAVTARYGVLTVPLSALMQWGPAKAREVLTDMLARLGGGRIGGGGGKAAAGADSLEALSAEVAEAAARWRKEGRGEPAAALEGGKGGFRLALGGGGGAAAAQAAKEEAQLPPPTAAERRPEKGLKRQSGASGSADVGGGGTAAAVKKCRRAAD